MPESEDPQCDSKGRWFQVSRPVGVSTVRAAGGPNAALSVWVVQQQGEMEDRLTFQSLLFLRHPDIQSDVWATPPTTSTSLGVKFLSPLTINSKAGIRPKKTMCCSFMVVTLNVAGRKTKGSYILSPESSRRTDLLCAPALAATGEGFDSPVWSGPCFAKDSFATGLAYKHRRPQAPSRATRLHAFCVIIQDVLTSPRPIPTMPVGCAGIG